MGEIARREESKKGKTKVAKGKSGFIKNNKTSGKKSIASRSDVIAIHPIDNERQFAALMSALMTDVITGAKSPDVVNACCNAGGKLLKVVEMRLRHGSKVKDLFSLLEHDHHGT